MAQVSSAQWWVERAAELVLRRAPAVGLWLDRASLAVLPSVAVFVRMLMATNLPG